MLNSMPKLFLNTKNLKSEKTCINNIFAKFIKENGLITYD
ncbi:hypothetical protein N474_23940 [Pseudoalteromonas luteoviolacea CPMOR-2]|uniref:Uncharacterized protein n=1 Tax=Pseudoalteromonas luteoviolacea DSM 6061 TaxID=1365250 RepID=A0A166UKD0_9GAMM|nr:hypothetical protein N475_05065 [Pseudoalteromonas luteoviolacea DSM 6061]KZN51726.1 hypothetical protein N474_23940 [Pseudoalteromonas luteoviolacea CPMOR-2]MBE0386421.1 hypothetical protein [Pseudoalteromonas luteoviolacea DSM 6061]